MKISSVTNSSNFKVAELFCASASTGLSAEDSTFFSPTLILEGIGLMKSTSGLNSKVRRDATT